MSFVSRFVIQRGFRNCPSFFNPDLTRTAASPICIKGNFKFSLFPSGIELGIFVKVAAVIFRFLSLVLKPS